jgi:hypothetical protein
MLNAVSGISVRFLSSEMTEVTILEKPFIHYSGRVFFVDETFFASYPSPLKSKNCLEGAVLITRLFILVRMSVYSH